MQTELGKLLQALAFFSRLILPDTLWRLAAPHRLHQCTPWFPVAGLLIGIVPAALLWSLSPALPPLVAAGLAVAAGVYITGALHEDGLADTADGIGGGSTREKALEIMRDSRIGTYGALALMLSMLLRISSLAAITTVSPLAGVAALLVSHSAGRGAIALALAFATYARTEGTGSLVSPGISLREFGYTLAISLLLGLLFGGAAGLSAVAAGLAGALVLLWRFRRKTGGYTGDALGAMEQVGEIIVLVVLAGFWGHS